LIHGLVAPALDSVETLCLRHIQRAQDESVQYTENHGVCANGHGQGHNGNSGKAGRFAQHAEREAQVLPERFDERSTRCFLTLLSESRMAAEFEAGAALGFRAAKTGALEIVSTMLDVGAKFVVHFRAHLRAMKERGDAEAKRVEEFHASSNCAPSAAPIAFARRFQLSVSSRRRLRPAAVSS
jgi:hypothetical protein